MKPKIKKSIANIKLLKIIIEGIPGSMSILLKFNKYPDKFIIRKIIEKRNVPMDKKKEILLANPE